MTNPPSVPSLGVEEWVRLLDDLIVMLAPHDAQSIADANQLRALASALPGMGKDSELLDAIDEHPDLLAYVRGGRNRVGVSTGGWLWCKRFDGPEEWALTFRDAVKNAAQHFGFIPSARVAQPKREDRLRDWTDAITCGPHSLWLTREHAERLASEGVISATFACNEWHVVPPTEGAYFALKQRVISEQDAARAAQPEETSADAK